VNKVKVINNNVKIGYYGQMRNANNFEQKVVDGITLAITDKNYYIDTKTMKPKFTKMMVGQASYSAMYSIYAVVNDAYIYVMVSSDTSLEKNLRRVAATVKMAYGNPDSRKNIENTVKETATY
jgi:hypothetical protein